MVDNELGSVIEYQDDLAEAEAPSALPPGDYPGQISNVTIAHSNNSGRLQAKVDFLIKPEDYPADYEDADAYPDGKTVSTYIPAEQDKASRWRMRQFCEAIGAKLSAKLDVTDWIGKTATLKITNEEYQGINRERLNSVQAD